MKLLGILLAAALVTTGAVAKEPLKTQVFTSADQLSVTSTIITGETEAMVVDPQFTLANAHRVAALVLESGKKLTYVYSTHPHPDHYFGNAVMKPTFPEAKLVALPKVIEGIEAGWDGRYNFWKATYGNNIPAAHVIPEALTSDTLKLDGETIKIVGPVQGDSPDDNSYVWIPSIKTIVGGDILFEDAHVPLGGAKPEQRKAWLKVISQMAKLKPTTVIAGHEGPRAKRDAAVLTFMHDYISYFDVALKESKSADELSAKIKERFPGLALEGLLNFSSAAAFPAPPVPVSQ